MPNPRLTEHQRKKIFVPFLQFTKAKLEKLSGNDHDLLFALRRKLAKELTYLERGTPAMRKKLKERKKKEQNGLCALCGKILPLSHTELDRIEAKKGYTMKNTRLVHHECHIQDQKRKRFA